MEWIQSLAEAQGPKISFKKLQKFTLYDHNYITDINEDAQTFTCVLNCKRMNRIYSTICQIEGDFSIGLIDISCRLLDQQHIIHGQWLYQKIQLARFAFRYNERSYRNIYIRVNPINGSISVTLSFMTGISIIEDEQKFREIITDLCHIVGQESQMIFNTMLEIIFSREANQPYLKSAIKVNPGFPRYMKVQKLLDKIKSLIATSSFYKIKSDISSAHKNRSFFKKIYLNSDKKYLSNNKIVQMARAYEIKFNKNYTESQKKTGEKSNQFIKDYIELEEKNEIEFAKHLNENLQNDLLESTLITNKILDVRQESNKDTYYLQYENNVFIEARRKVFQNEEKYRHELNILKLIAKKHPNISQHYAPEQPQKQIKNWMFIKYEQEIPLSDYLRKNSRVISLSTKLFIMSQICSFIQYLHKKNIGYFIQMCNIYITKGLQLKIQGFQKAYTVNMWFDNIVKQNQKLTWSNLMIPKNNYQQFPYIYIIESELNNEKCDILSVGACLYLILMDKFPFNQQRLNLENRQLTVQNWKKNWIVETEYFLTKGGQIVKIIAHLLLKCMDIQNILTRPYVEWLLVILCEVRTSLNGLY